MSTEYISGASLRCWQTGIVNFWHFSDLKHSSTHPVLAHFRYPQLESCIYNVNFSCDIITYQGWLSHPSLLFDENDIYLVGRPSICGSQLSFMGNSFRETYRSGYWLCETTAIIIVVLWILLLSALSGNVYSSTQNSKYLSMFLFES